MSTTPTNQPVPSEKPQDLKFNAGKIDEFVTSMARQYIDRFGQAHYTIEGLRWVAQQAIATFGYITLDSFEDGNTLTLPNQVLRLEANSEYYRWDGAFPKKVSAGSTPDSTGGIGVGAWLSVGDATLRPLVINEMKTARFDKTDGFNFSSGFTLNNRKQVAFNSEDGFYYQFLGSLPVTISPGTTPQKNINGGEWLNVGNGTDLAYYGYVSSWGLDDVTDVINGLWLAGREVVIDINCIARQLKLVSGCSIKGLDSKLTMTLVPPTSVVSGEESANLYHAPGDGDLSDVFISNLTIDGGRYANPAIQYHHCIGIWASSGEVIKNLNFTHLSMKNAGEDFIKLVCTDANSSISDISVYSCDFKTDDDKLGLAGYSAPSSGNGIRTIASYDPYASYGDKKICNVKVINCKAKKIRTLTDFKRGTYSSISTIHYTEDMYDCHHSCDGAFNIVIDNITCNTNSNFNEGTATNFIEIQGENVIVTNVTGNGNDITKQGIFVTDYGLPEENGVGHNSVNVSLDNVKLLNLLSDGIKVQNGINCIINNITIQGCKGHPVLFASGSGRVDDAGYKLEGYYNSFDGVNGSGWTNPPKCQGVNFIKGRVVNAQGQDDLYIPGNILREATDEYGAWKNKYLAKNLVANNYLEFTAGSGSNLKWFVNDRTYEEVVYAPSVPPGEPMAVTVSDQSTTALREIYYPPFKARKDDIFYARVWALKGSADNFSIAVQELDSSKNLIGSTTFYGIEMSSVLEWKELVMKHAVASSNASYVMFGLIPAGGYNTPANTGTTNLSNLRIGRSPFGVS
ncbi:hypothetical protein JTV59_002250 [Salmonella enterica subsp. enterica serovar Minnesota]|nr:hypothetical protein [Salmonella enterica subsp. enterica serovar Minnesota]